MWIHRACVLDKVAQAGIDKDIEVGMGGFS